MTQCMLGYTEEERHQVCRWVPGVRLGWGERCYVGTSGMAGWVERHCGQGRYGRTNNNACCVAHRAWVDKHSMIPGVV